MSTTIFKRIESSPSFPKLETAVLERWKNEGTFKRSVDKNKGKPEFIFYDGPPFPTGNPHHGTIFVSILKDIIPRYKTMRGYYVPRTWGWDCHGLPIETHAEKNLGIKHKNEIGSTVSVADFNAECRKIVSTFNDSWRTYIDGIGRWVDMDNCYRTMDTKFMESVIWAFKASYDKGLIYKDYRVTPYCYRCQTPLSMSDARLDDATRPKQDRAITVKFKLKDEANTSVLVWTTTPWTLPSNVALAFGKSVTYVKLKVGEESLILAQSRVAAYEKAIGKSLEVLEEISGEALVKKYTSGYEPLFPYFAGKVKNGFKLILGDFVSTDDGSGVVHLAPAFGEDDYWTCKRAEIGFVAPVDESGIYSAEVSDFAGRNVHEANGDVIKFLKGKGIVVDDNTVEHNYPHCWRCRTPLIYRAVDAWYFSVEQIKEKLIQANQEINWYPENIKNGRFGKWLENARDWNISRNRYWATPIPVWNCKTCGKQEVLGSCAEIEAKAGRKVPDLHKEFLDEITYACACGKGTMTRTEEVLDGWFESGSMPYGQFHYPFENAEHFRAHFPADFIVEYPGQIRGWFYLLHVLSVALFDKPAFKNCLVHGTLLAADSKKISKSLKNYTDPLELLQKYGADALRSYLLSSPAVQMDDMSFKDEGLDSMIKSIHLPLWNALSFFTSYAEIDELKISAVSTVSGELTELDKYILSEIELCISKIQAHLDRYDIHLATQELPQFLETLNNWYIRRSRPRVWASEKTSADKLAFYSTLYRVLSRFSQILAPFCPFLAETVWAKLGYTESVHLSDWPVVDTQAINESLSKEIAQTRAIITAGLSIRAKKEVRVRQPLASMQLYTANAYRLEQYYSVIRDELNVKTITVVTNPDDIAQRVAKPNAKKLGPKYGGAVQQIIKQVKEGTFTVDDQGKVHVDSYVLLPDEVEVGFVAKEGLAVESNAGNVVALDMNITPELFVEGEARDLVRAIQDLRKEANLHLADRIALSILGAEEVIAAHADYIAQETLCQQLNKGQLRERLIDKHIIIGQRKIIIELEKLS